MCAKKNIYVQLEMPQDKCTNIDPKKKDKCIN